MRIIRTAGFVVTLLGLITAQSWAKEGRLLRFPDVHNGKVVFTYAGDLWLVPGDGGSAQRLTTHEGEEIHAKFSPDGEMIAFTGMYDGGNHVYIVPTQGGEPRQLTFHASYDQVVDWFPDGKKILFRSNREGHDAANSRLYSIGIEGGLPEPLPLPEAGMASFSPDGRKLAYNRQFNEFRTWKRYKGGTAQDVWIYDLDNNTIEQITDWEGTDNCPMWYGNKIYYNSDREHTLNIFAYDVSTGKTEKVTNHNEYDVKWPSLGGDKIVYENGGYLYCLDLVTQKTKKIPVELNSDLILARPSFENVSNLIRNFDISPTGKRAVFEARGDIFTVPAEKGDIRNITQSPGVREINPAWSPDGKWIAYLSDKSGEYEIYIRSQDGTGSEERITNDGDCYRFLLFWSPDSKKILYSDKKFRLYYVDIESKMPVLVDQAEYTEVHHYSWSPDSKWIAYTKNNSNFYEEIYLYSLDDKETHQITGDLNDDVNPVFDPDGKYLYFISFRSFSPTFSEFDGEYAFRNARNIYLLTLQADTLSPFAPESDEEEIKEDKADEKDDKGEEKNKKETGDNKKPEDIKIDFEGIGQRIAGFPIPSGNYVNLSAAKGKIFYLSLPAISGDNIVGDDKLTLHMYDISEQKDNVLLKGLRNYSVSQDGKKIVYGAGETYGIIDVQSKESSVGDGRLDFSMLQAKVDPQKEWEQMFNEAWRLERDFFYDPNMHGVDWNLMKKRYGQLLPYVADRSDLTYIIGEMIGELCSSHTYVYGGQKPEVPGTDLGLLGADFEVDPNSAYYRIKKIYRGENWKKNRRAPLTEPGVVINEGDYLIAVNGKEIRRPANLYTFFDKTADHQIKISVNSKPSSEGAREYVVKPVSSESQLRYLDWVETNRRRVEEATGGHVGYVHVPNTSLSGLNEFSRGFFAQAEKDGLIVDIRYNSGGMSPDKFLERLDRRVLNFWSSREGKLKQTPQVAMHGPMACITNEYAGSGGDSFPYYFRELGLGPLIGTRTWGGLVGISRYIPLVDGGTVTVPEIAFINLKGEWDVENHGVDPDIKIDNRPDLVVMGQDPQLEKAIEEIMREIKEAPVRQPERPPYPKKS
jgi:tricorn protease